MSCGSVVGQFAEDPPTPAPPVPAPAVPPLDVVLLVVVEDPPEPPVPLALDVLLVVVALVPVEVAAVVPVPDVSVLSLQATQGTSTTRDQAIIVLVRI